MTRTIIISSLGVVCYPLNADLLFQVKQHVSDGEVTLTLSHSASPSRDLWLKFGADLVRSIPVAALIYTVCEGTETHMVGEEYNNIVYKHRSDTIPLRTGGSSLSEAPRNVFRLLLGPNGGNRSARTVKYVISAIVIPV